VSVCGVGAWWMKNKVKVLGLGLKFNPKQKKGGCGRVLGEVATGHGFTSHLTRHDYVHIKYVHALISTHKMLFNF
jgi:hypothetical protein